MQKKTKLSTILDKYTVDQEIEDLIAIPSQHLVSYTTFEDKTGSTSEQQQAPQATKVLQGFYKKKNMIMDQINGLLGDIHRKS